MSTAIEEARRALAGIEARLTHEIHSWEGETGLRVTEIRLDRTDVSPLSMRPGSVSALAVRIVAEVRSR